MKATWNVRTGVVSALSLAAMLSLTGCTAKAAGDLRVMADDALLAEASLDDQGAWQSAPWHRSVWIPYDDGSTVIVEHGLGRVPTSVEVYISPDGDDRKTQEPRFAFIASGDIATLAKVTETEVWVNNNTRGNYSLRLVLR